MMQPACTGSQPKWISSLSMSKTYPSMRYGILLRPSRSCRRPSALGASQDRFDEKSLFRELRIPTAPFAAVDSRNDLANAAARIGLPGVLKTRRLGYDGRGQYVVRTQRDIGIAWEQLGSVPLIYEGFIDFSREVSIIGVRSTRGEIRSYPLAANAHSAGILRHSIAPYRNAALQRQAETYLRRLLRRFDYAGVLTIEFFARGGKLIANEMAPRVHNSGHWTIEGAQTSQFENHLRAILGLPLGSTEAYRARGHAELHRYDAATTGRPENSRCALSQLRQGAARESQARARNASGRVGRRPRPGPAATCARMRALSGSSARHSARSGRPCRHKQTEGAAGTLCGSDPSEHSISKGAGYNVILVQPYPTFVPGTGFLNPAQRARTLARVRPGTALRQPNQMSEAWPAVSPEYRSVRTPLHRMYLELFKLQELPFRLSPDPAFLFMSKHHARAKAYMESTIWFTDGFVIITGEIGSGKTTLIETFLKELEKDVVVAQISQTQVSSVEFLQSVLAQWGFQPFRMKKAELLATLNEFLVEQYSQGRRVLLIVDEAQNLSGKVLEEIRLLSGIETTKEKVLRIILAGQPELNEKLNSPSLVQLSQRVRLKFHLTALSETDTTAYIQHRLEVAGSQGREIFAPDTYPLIYRYTGGVPRLVNTLCDTSMMAAFAHESDVVIAQGCRASHRRNAVGRVCAACQHQGRCSSSGGAGSTRSGSGAGRSTRTARHRYEQRRVRSGQRSGAPSDPGPRADRLQWTNDRRA